MLIAVQIGFDSFVTRRARAAARGSGWKKKPAAPRTAPA
jgi:hypothetical protein